jgi:hypothetical protein
MSPSNTWPMTAARSSRSRSSPSSRSRRAASSAWIVGGVPEAARSPVTTQAPSSCRSRPSSSRAASSSSMNNGLPAAAPVMRSLAARGRLPSPVRPSSRAPASAWPRGSSSTVTALARPPAQAGRSSSSSERAMPTSRTGRPCGPSAIPSSRSRKVGSAQCRSSKTSSSGRSAASVSSSRLVAQAASSIGAGAASSPISWPTRSATRGPSSERSGDPPASTAASLALAEAGGSSRPMPAAWRTTSASGQKVLPLP